MNPSPRPVIPRPRPLAAWTWNRILVPVMFVVLTVFSVTQTIAIQHIGRTQKSLDLIEECTTPGTRCSKLSEENRIKRTQELLDAAFCATETALAAPGLPTRPEREAFFANCTVERHGPPPAP